MTENVLQEAALIQRVAQKDQAALGELYDRMSGVLFSVAVRIVRNQWEAQEVLQDVFVQIWQRASSYNSVAGRPITWAIVITRNKAIDLLRQQKRHTEFLEKLHETESVLARNETGNATEGAVSGEMKDATVKALREIGEEQRCAIELAFFGGLTQAEIASKLGQPLGTIKARIRRGMVQLRNLLEEEKLNVQSFKR